MTPFFTLASFIFAGPERRLAQIPDLSSGSLPNIGDISSIASSGGASNLISTVTSLAGNLGGSGGGSDILSNLGTVAGGSGGLGSLASLAGALAAAAVNHALPCNECLWLCIITVSEQMVACILDETSPPPTRLHLFKFCSLLPTSVVDLSSVLQVAARC